MLENFFKIPVLIRAENKQVKVDALLDTGNQLKDPMTGRPVIVVEYTSLKPLLPVQLHPFFEADGDADIWEILSSLGGCGAASRFCAIPFQSLGKTEGCFLVTVPMKCCWSRMAGSPARLRRFWPFTGKACFPAGLIRRCWDPTCLKRPPSLTSTWSGRGTGRSGRLPNCSVAAWSCRDGSDRNKRIYPVRLNLHL